MSEATKTELKAILNQTGTALMALQRLQVLMWPMKRGGKDGPASVPGLTEANIDNAIKELQQLAVTVNAWIQETRDGRLCPIDVVEWTKRIKVTPKGRSAISTAGGHSVPQPASPGVPEEN